MEQNYVICHWPHLTTSALDVICLKKEKMYMPLSSVFCDFHFVVSFWLTSPPLFVAFFFRRPIKTEDYSRPNWRVEGGIFNKAKVWGTSGHCWFYEIPLNAPYIPLWPTAAPLLQHKVFTAATHYQRMNITPVWMPLHELIEQKVTARTGLWSKLWNGAP